VKYVNTGDWVESCTALVEHQDGRLEILRWLPDDRGTRKAIVQEPTLGNNAPAWSGDGAAASSNPAFPASGGDGESTGLPHLDA